MRHVDRGGTYFRVADPDWENPLDGSYSVQRGGRWNPSNTFPLVYLNHDVRVARANVMRRFAGLPYGPELLDPDAAPVLISTVVPDEKYVDVVTDDGCLAVGLPLTYPKDEDGNIVGWEVCQRIGTRAWEANERGITCRSAAGGPADGEELAWFQHPDREPLRVETREAFDEWFW